ncbi:MAG TPA: hypothetical protein VGM25_14155 [Caulobacteraceae bacterium]
MTGPCKTAPLLALGLSSGLALALALPMTLALPASASAEDQAQAPLQDQRLEKTFGSTIVSTYPDGRQAELWLKRDGSYESEGRRHDRSSGTWQIKDDGKQGHKLCMKQRKPFPAPFSFCTPTPDNLDHPWNAKAYTGEQVSVRLVRGMFDPSKGGPQDGNQKAQAPHAEDKG